MSAPELQTKPRAIDHSDHAEYFCPGSGQPVATARPEIGDGICGVCGQVVGVR